MKSDILLPDPSFLNQLIKLVLRLKTGIQPKTIELFSKTFLFSGIMSAELERHFQRYQLSQPGFLVLVILRTNPDQIWTPTELAEAIGVRPPTMTGITDTLEKQGLIERRASTSDRRKSYILLTKIGKKRLGQILPDHFNRLQQAFGHLATPEFLNQFSSIMDALQLAVESLNNEVNNG